MPSILIVFLGAGIGGSLRHLVNLGCLRACGPGFPVGTMAINILGSGLMGLIAGYFAVRAQAPWAQPARLFLTTGILGGFTTFSAFSLDAALLYERGDIGMAAFYVMGSVVISIAALFLGLALARTLLA